MIDSSRPTQAITVRPITPRAYWARAIASESVYNIVEGDVPPPPLTKWCTLLTPIP